MATERKEFWQIDGDNNQFDTLREAKYHINIAYTPKERIKWLNRSTISHFKGGDFISWVDIRVNDKGVARFGKVQTSFIKK